MFSAYGVTVMSKQLFSIDKKFSPDVGVAYSP